MTSSSQTQVVTSFRKKGKEALNIKGTRVSVQNAQLLTSTGSSTFDFFLGGGLAIGTICLIEEDHYNTYSSLLLKYFLAEGIICNHSIFLASGDKDPEKLLKELPGSKNVEFEKDSKQIAEASNDDLKIAWRYKNQTSAANDAKSPTYSCGYDLSKTIPEEILEKAEITTWNPAEHTASENEICDFVDSPYSVLFKTIKAKVLSGFKTSEKTCDNVLRIGICSMGSPLWQGNDNKKENLNLIRFLYMLKSLLRTSFAVAVVTLPAFLLKDFVLTSRLHQVADTVVNLESFVGSNKKSNPLFKDFDGELSILHQC
ncbi:elongator complex protein 4-like [Uloborus diversus]|uniref:elongator complex protein 4-like n=1 Tax=Uloborus diversus TaxID=327109 RepID=UPI002409AC7B|nr:elongator complex protein 4-like [Uloborus diversus]